MNHQIKEKWVNALRSGEYQQGSGALHPQDKYCCLGVLCDIYAKENDTYWQEDKDNSDYSVFMGEKDYPPVPVMKWAEIGGERLSVNDPSVKIYDEDDGDWVFMSAAKLNDEGYDFNQIAKLIEEQL